MLITVIQEAGVAALGFLIAWLLLGICVVIWDMMRPNTFRALVASVGYIGVIPMLVAGCIIWPRVAQDIINDVTPY